MARKTKAELVAEREAALAAERLEEQLAYPLRLMAVLEDAITNNSYELSVSGGTFVLRNRNENTVYQLHYSYNSNTQFTLEDLEDDLRDAAEVRELAKKRYEMKQAALAKLSKEERELLGL